ncbi:MAG TPA: hydrogenase iron-sulfur subunit, partial [Thermoplasmata archaeon]|nr:hydrogenase iron-sulfur subunit [Thermoplasmata archaeon]
DASRCTKCMACEAVCPARAISVGEMPEIDQIACIGCGACVSECPTKVFELAHYTDWQLRQQIEGILEGEADEVRIIGFFGDILAYVAADSAGTARMEYPASIRVIRVPSAARTGRGEILTAFGKGADGVVLSDEEDGEVAHLVEKRLEALGPELDALGIGRDRVVFIPMLLPIYKVLPKMIETFDRKVASLGTLSPEVRARALTAAETPSDPVFGRK